MQVILNLSHDPTTADSTQAALKSVGVRVNERVPTLVRAAVLGSELPDDEAARIGRFFYNLVRGLALDQELLEAMPIEHSAPRPSSTPSAPSSCVALARAVER